MTFVARGLRRPDSLQEQPLLDAAGALQELRDDPDSQGRAGPATAGLRQSSGRGMGEVERRGGECSCPGCAGSEAEHENGCSLPDSRLQPRRLAHTSEKAADQNTAERQPSIDVAAIRQITAGSQR